MKSALKAMPRALYNSLIAWRPAKSALDFAITSILPEKVRIPEGTVYINQKDPAISSMLFFGVFEPYFSSVFRQTVRPGMNVIDIGANIGYYTLLASKLCGPTGAVIAYEPDAENLSYLEKNVSANKLSNVIIEKKAVSDRNGMVKFYVSEDNLCTHGLIENRPSKSSMEVPCETLDSARSVSFLPKIDVIKMDIEGAEALALAGMRQVLGKNTGITVLSEFYPKAMRRIGVDPKRFLQSFVDMGFTISIIDEKKQQIRPIARDGFDAFIASFPDGESVENLYIKRP